MVWSARPRLAPRCRHRSYPQLECHLEVRTTNYRYAVPPARGRVVGQPPHLRVAVEPNPHYGQIWRRTSPPSCKTFNRYHKARWVAVYYLASHSPRGPKFLYSIKCILVNVDYFANPDCHNACSSVLDSKSIAISRPGFPSASIRSLNYC